MHELYHPFAEPYQASDRRYLAQIRRSAEETSAILSKSMTQIEESMALLALAGRILSRGIMPDA